MGKHRTPEEAALLPQQPEVARVATASAHVGTNNAGGNASRVGAHRRAPRAVHRLAAALARHSRPAGSSAAKPDSETFGLAKQRAARPSRRRHHSECVRRKSGSCNPFNAGSPRSLRRIWRCRRGPRAVLAEPVRRGRSCASGTRRATLILEVFAQEKKVVLARGPRAFGPTEKRSWCYCPLSRSVNAALSPSSIDQAFAYGFPEA